MRMGARSRPSTSTTTTSSTTNCNLPRVINAALCNELMAHQYCLAAMVDLWNAGDTFGVELEGNWHLGTGELDTAVSNAKPIASSSVGTDGIEQHSMLGPPDRPNPSKTSGAPSTETTTAVLTLRAAGRTKGHLRLHVDTKAQEPFLVVGMAVFKTMEESRSNNSLETSFCTVRRGQSNVDGDGDALRIYTRAVLWARTSPDVEPSVLNTAMGVAESSPSFYSPSNKPSDVSYYVSTLSKFWISFLRRYGE